MNDTVLAYIRTYAPIFAGAVVAFLVSVGVIDTDASTNLIVALTTVFTVVAQGLWYLIGRLLTERVPWLAKLMLGSTKTPSYF